MIEVGQAGELGRGSRAVLAAARRAVHRALSCPSRGRFGGLCLCFWLATYDLRGLRWTGTIMASCVEGGETVTFPSEHSAGEGRGVMFGNPKLTPKAIIVLHEWWGLTEDIQKQAISIGQDGGFTTFVADMYRGKRTRDFEEAGHMMETLDFDGAVKDVAGAAKLLQQRGCTKVGVMGFCMGGAVSFLSALKVPEISAAAPFYGIPKDRDSLVAITKPVQVHYAEKDHVKGFSSKEDFVELGEKLRAGGVPLEMFEYVDRGHAFVNIDSHRYHEKDAEKALRRVYEFFQKHLS